MKLTNAVALTAISLGAMVVAPQIDTADASFARTTIHQIIEPSDQTTIAWSYADKYGTQDGGFSEASGFSIFADGTLRMSGRSHRGIFGYHTEVTLAPPAGEVLHVGTYANAVDPEGRGTRPGMKLKTENGCWATTQTFVINEISYEPNGEIASLSADFEITCGTVSGDQGTFSGMIRHNAVSANPALYVQYHSVESAEPSQSREYSNLVRVTNLGPGAAEIGTVRITGDNNFAFSLDDRNCAGVTLEPGETCEIHYNFVPFGAVSLGYDATLEIEADSWFDTMSASLTTRGYAFQGGGRWVVPAYTDRVGYWTLQSNGEVTDFGQARPMHWSKRQEAIQIEADPAGRGYWTMNRSGTIRWFGGAPDLGQIEIRDFLQILPDEQVAAMSATPTGKGLWVFSTAGRVFRIGDAPDVGDLTRFNLAAQIVGSVATASGNGALMLGSDGGVFALGDAEFAGSVPEVLPGVTLNEPLVGIVADPDGHGYWLVAADGGVFAFDAPFRGSVPQALGPGGKLAAPIVDMVPYGNGYLLVAGDGGVFNFSDRPFSGSLGDISLDSPVVSITALPAQDRYVDAVREVTP